MITNKKHQIFADEYILTNDAVISYQKAYPKAKSESARVESYRILQLPTVDEYIKSKQSEIQNARQNSLIQELKSKDSSNILNREKIVEMQSNVVKITYNNFVKSKASKDADAFNKSVMAFNKLEGLEKATKIENEIKLSKDVVINIGS
jgi:hypothetical protein